MTLNHSETDQPGTCIAHPKPDLSPKTVALEAAYSRPGRILIVEDMQELAQLHRENLLACGYEVEVTYDGAAALALVKNRSFDLALIDIDLPDISGFEVVTQARSAGHLRQARIIFCTGGYVEERRAQARQFAGSDFIAKPFALKTLLAMVHS